MLWGCNSVAKERTFKVSPRLQNYDIFSFIFGEALQKVSNPLHTSIMYNDIKSKWQIWQTLNNGLKWYDIMFIFFVLKIFLQSIFMPHQSTHQFLLASQFKTALGVQSSFSIQWIVYSKLMRIWLLLLNLCHFLRFKCFKF